jgi:hypothetical protein
MLTDVELVSIAGRFETWLRFGRSVRERDAGPRRRLVSFAPDSVFALVRWQAGDAAAAGSRLDVVRAVRPGEGLTLLPFVAPGGELLLRAEGARKVQQALDAIAAVERVVRDAGEAAPDHWRHVGNRLAAGLEPRPYSRARHSAWQLRRALAP